MRWFMVPVLAMVAFLALGANAKAACGAQYFSGIAERLSAIEADDAAGAPAAFARDNELTAIFADGAPVWHATSDPCPGVTATIALRDLARQRALVLWGHMLGLRALDAPVYPARYASACSTWDVRSWQVAFISAWVESLRPAEPHDAKLLNAALSNDPRYAHARSLALDRARRIRVTQLPSAVASNETWLASNEHALDAAVPRDGQSCGPANHLWALRFRQTPDEKLAANVH